MANNVVENVYTRKDIKKFLPKYDNPNYDFHHIKTPFMGAIVASTGGGKTNLLCNLIRAMNNTFDKIYVATQEQEPLYEYLKDKLKDGISIVYDLKDMPDLTKFKENSKDSQFLFVFDDQNKVKDQNYIETCYKRARKLGISCLYLSQSFYDIPIFIRKNLHYLLLLKIAGTRDLKSILQTFNLGMDVQQLLKLYKTSTQEPFNFLKIDLKTNDDNKKFSHNWNEFFDVTTTS